MEHLTSLSHTRHESCRTVMYGIFRNFVIFVIEKNSWHRSRCLTQLGGFTWWIRVRVKSKIVRIRFKHSMVALTVFIVELFIFSK